MKSLSEAVTLRISWLDNGVKNNMVVGDVILKNLKSEFFACRYQRNVPSTRV